MNPFIIRTLLSLALGALIGLEREYSKRQELAGLRTFALVSLTACLSQILSGDYGFPFLIPLSFTAVIILGLYLYLSKVGQKAGFGLTSTLALFLAYLVGILAGVDMYYEAVLISITVTLILFERSPLRSFVRHLTDQEIRDSLEFGIVAFIIYPLLPETISYNSFVIDLKIFWFAVVAISILNFIAFLSIRFFDEAKSLGLLAFFGGVIGSTATVLSLKNIFSKKKTEIKNFIGPLLLINSAMVLRNMALISIFYPYIILNLGPFALSIFLLSLYFFRKGYDSYKHKMSKAIKYPFAVPPAIKLGAMIFILTTLLEFLFILVGSHALYFSFFGGMADSKATTASALLLLTNQAIGLTDASLMVFLTCIGSMISTYTLLFLSGAKDLVKSALKYQVPILLISSLVFAGFFGVSV
jgi:uncharacterized membrane protein (DUF4010 family)